MKRLEVKAQPPGMGPVKIAKSEQNETLYHVQTSICGFHKAPVIKLIIVD